MQKNAKKCKKMSGKIWKERKSAYLCSPFEIQRVSSNEMFKQKCRIVERGPCTESTTVD